MIFELYKTNDDRNVINKVLTDRTVFDIVLKTNTNIYSPTISIYSDEDLTGFNYARIEHFERYYFIEVIEPYPNGIYNFHLVCDVLETFKEDIFKSRHVQNNQEISVLIDIVEADVDPRLLFERMSEVSYVLSTLGVDYIGNDN